MRLISLLPLCLLSSSLPAQEIGDTIVVICENETEVKSTGRKVSPVWRGTHLRVEGVVGNSFLVEWENQKVLISNQDVASLDLAGRIFTQAIAENPTAYEYSYRGMVLFAKGEFFKAVDDFDQSLRLDPSLADVWYDRARAWEQLRNLRKAHSDYDEAIRLDPNNEAAYYCRGCLWLKQNNFDRALADFSAAIRLNPSDDRSYLMRGRVRTERKQFDRALEDFNRVIQRSPSLPIGYLYRANLWQSQGELSKAIADYNEVVRLDPQNSHAHHSLAWIYSSSGNREVLDPKKAIEHAETACQLTGWKDSGPLSTLAAAYAEAGDFKHAVEYQQKAYALYSDSEKEAWGNLTELYKSGKTARSSGKAADSSQE